MKIPDDVFENRCRWCIFHETGRENVEIPNGSLFTNYATRNAPCRIEGICGCKTVPGECLSFQPKAMFGICHYCAFSNMFRDGFCAHPEGPKSKHPVYLTAQHGESGYWDCHACYTCDRYRVEPGWKDCILKNVKSGMAPANFNPDTWEPIKQGSDSLTTARWAKMIEEEQKKRKAEAAAAAEKAVPAADNEGQLTLF